MDYFGVPNYASQEVMEADREYTADEDMILYCSVLETYVTFHIQHKTDSTVDYDAYFSIGRGYWPETYEGTYWHKTPYIPIYIKAGATYSFSGAASLRIVAFPLSTTYGVIPKNPS